MRVLITGSRGFVGKNLSLRLLEKGVTVLGYDKDNSVDELDDLLKEADFIFHLAGVNRSSNPADFYSTNSDLTSLIIEKIKQHNLNVPLAFTSSIQATLNNDYGLSKKSGEDTLLDYAKVTNNKVYIFRLPNLFGKWSRPNYNSVIATFCHNVAHAIPLTLNSDNPVINFAYIDDVVDCFINLLENGSNELYQEVNKVYQASIHQLAETINSFKDSRTNLLLPQTGDEFVNKLYSTYLSYLPEEDFVYDVVSHKDQRGSFTELLKTSQFGQVSVNVAHKGIVKGNHYHHSKNEKFIVVSGRALLRMRKVDTSKIIEYYLDAKKIQIVDIPPGYIHEIVNIGEEDMIFIIWANELFSPDKPDTIYQKVDSND